MGPAYRIDTARTVIRCWQPADAPLLKAAIDDSLDHLRQWMTWAAVEPEDLEVKIERLRRKRAEFDLGQDFTYGLFDRGEAEVLGSSGLHPRVGPRGLEIGYWIRKSRAHQGLATETTAALTKVAFLINDAARVQIHCDPANEFSLAIPRRLGFQHEATLRQRYPMPDGTLRDSMIWTLLAADYPATPCAQLEVQATDAIGRKLL